MQRNFDDRFSNWVAWCKYRGLHQDRAKSIEGAYRSPQIWDARNAKPDWLLNMDIPDAIMVNRAYSQLGERIRRVIKVIWFKPHWRPQWQAQKLGCHFTQLGELADHAKCVMKNRLDFLERRNSITVKVSVTTVKTVNPPAGAELCPEAR